jgi:hypothetical protein
MLKILGQYHQALYDLVEDEDYDKYDDFTVVIQPGLKNLKLPKNYVTFFGMHKSFLPDLSYLSSDCFHPSQKLQALCKYLYRVDHKVVPLGANKKTFFVIARFSKI